MPQDDYHLHKASKPFEDFHNGLRDSKIEWAVKDGQSYYETGVGFMYAVRLAHATQAPLAPKNRGPALDVKASQKPSEPRKQAAGVNRHAAPAPP